MLVSAVGCQSEPLINNPAEMSLKPLEEVCTSYLILSAHYFKHISDFRDSQGYPRFKFGVDEIIGPVVGQKYLIASRHGFFPEVFITGDEGTVDRMASEFGGQDLKNRPVPLTDQVYINEKGARVMLVTVKSMENEIKKEYQIPCDSTVEIDVKIPDHRKDLDDFPDEFIIK